MHSWTQLSRLVLIGTEQQAPEPASLGDAGLDGALASFGSMEQREQVALSTGAALTLARRAGYKPGRTTPAASPAPLETQPRCPSAAGQDLARMLRDYLPQVLPEWLELAGAAGFRAPEEFLPELLDQAKAHTELRPPVEPVLGRRGTWLAAQNPDWSFALRVSDPEKSWQEGRRPERLAALREIRQANPSRARDLLGLTWKDEPPEERAEFILILATGLSLEDEPFLESSLDDKRKEVRTNAVRLLGSLPDSRLVQRMTGWATPLLQIKKKLLRNASLEITPPAECTKEMSRYGIGSSQPPGKEIGEKAWWLKEMLDVIPPSHWNRVLGLEPRELLLAAIKTDWAKTVLAGWAEAAGRYRDSGWMKGWLETALAHEELLTYAPTLIVGSAEIPSELKASITDLVRQAGQIVEADHLHSLIGRIPRPWSEAFSRLILSKLQQGLDRYHAHYSGRFRWHALLKNASLAVPPAMSQAISGWPREIEQNNVREIVDEFCAVIEFRRAVHRHLKGEK